MSWSGHFTLASRCLDGQKRRCPEVQGPEVQGPEFQRPEVQSPDGQKSEGQKCSAKARSPYGQKSGWAEVRSPDDKTSEGQNYGRPEVDEQKS